MFESSFDGILLVTLEGEVLDANPAACRLLGRPRTEFVSNSRLPIFGTASQQAASNLERAFEELRATGGFRGNLTLLRGNGAPLKVEVSGSTYPVGAIPDRAAMIFRPLHPQRTVEEALWDIEAQYRALVDTSSDAIILTRLDTTIFLCNTQAARLYGYESEEDLLGKSALDLVAVEDHRNALKSALDMLEEGDLRNVEFPLVKKDGSHFAGEISASIIYNTQGEPVAILGVLRDVSDRKRAEQRYRQLFERNLAGMYRSTPGGRILDCNHALVALLGCDSRDELLGSLATDFYFDVADREGTLSTLEERHGVTNQELCLRRKDGQPLWVLESSSVIECDHGQPVVYEGTIIDITERKRAELALRASEQRYRQLFERNLAGVYRTSLDGTILDCNEALVRMLHLGS
jgi:PAS domain S-box-containing protein